MCWWLGCGREKSETETCSTTNPCHYGNECADHTLEWLSFFNWFNSSYVIVHGEGQMLLLLQQPSNGFVKSNICVPLP